MACHLDLFPWAELVIGLFQLAFDTALQLAYLVGNINAAVRAHMAQLFDLPLKGRNRFFKIQKMSHIRLFFPVWPVAPDHFEV